MSEQLHQASENGGTNTTNDANEDAGFLNVTDADTLQEAMDQLAQDDDFLLFLAPSMELDLSPLRPSHAHVFSLWQIYLDNINPILKVTHTPTLQASIADAVNNPTAIDSSLETLLFGVYCVAVLSLTESECFARFHVTRSELLARYQIACRESLLRCRFLRSRSRHCLTGLYLYLISIKPYVDRRSLCMMLGTAIRIARQMGIDDESINMRNSPFEAEMRRRLWWSLVLFDARVCESSHNLACSSLVSTWDCKMPRNLNDFETAPETKALPATHKYPTEALYVVVINSIAQHLRHCNSNLSSTDPLRAKSQTTISNDTSPEDIDEFTAVEEMLHRSCFKAYDPDVPLHFLTQWTARSQLAKARLLNYYSECSKRPSEITETQRHAAMKSALESIESEAQLFNSPKTQGFRWHFTHLPFAAYAHVVQDLKSRPSQQSAADAWTILSKDFATRFDKQPIDGHPIFKLFADSVIEAWKARQAAPREPDEDEPWLIQEMKRVSRSGPLEQRVMDLDQDELQRVALNFSGEYLDPNTWAVT